MTNSPTNAELLAEISHLHQRIAELEQSAQQATLLSNLIMRLPIGIDLWQLEDEHDPFSLRLILSNGAMRNAAIDIKAAVGKRFKEIFPMVPDSILEHYRNSLKTGQPFVIPEIRVRLDADEERIATIHAIPITEQYLCVIAEDITAKKRSEAALVQIEEQTTLIRQQQELMSELSTPLIPINDQIMVMPLIGTIDSRRAQQVLEVLLDGIGKFRTRVAILDITGVVLIDTQVANALIQVAQAARLLGTQVILTGIRPEVAQTLVDLGVSLSGIITRSRLQDGITYAFEH